jgi:hypothetical protein
MINPVAMVIIPVKIVLRLGKVAKMTPENPCFYRLFEVPIEG